MTCLLCGRNLTHTHALNVGGGNHSHDGGPVCFDCINKAGVMSHLLGIRKDQA